MRFFCFVVSYRFGELDAIGGLFFFLRTCLNQIAQMLYNLLPYICSFAFFFGWIYDIIFLSLRFCVFFLCVRFAILGLQLSMHICFVICVLKGCIKLNFRARCCTENFFFVFLCWKTQYFFFSHRVWSDFFDETNLAYGHLVCCQCFAFTRFWCRCAWFLGAVPFVASLHTFFNVFMLNRWCRHFAIFLSCEWPREIAPVVVCGHCFCACSLIYAFRIPCPSFERS